MQRRVDGSVVMPGGGGQPRPVPGAWVTLHRVGSGSAGPLDSARTDAGGRFAITYPRAVTDSAVFFLSAELAGITYFSSPLPDAPVSGEDADLVVYDTTSSAAHVTLRGRHVIVGARDSTRRHPVVEVVELANDTTLTIVAADGRPTWSAPLPEGAQDVRLASGDLSPDAITTEEGRLRLVAPVAPGIKQISYSYQLPATSFPLTLAIEDSLPLLEVLLEDPAGTVTGASLALSDTVTMDGRTFRRFLARDAAAGTARVAVAAAGADRRTVYFTSVVLALGLLMLLALGRSVRRRPAPVPLGWNGDLGPTPEELARRIAALDASFQRRRAPSVEERQEYERLRGGLKAQLTDAIARHGGSGVGA